MDVLLENYLINSLKKNNMALIDKETIRAEIERRFWDYGTPLHDEEVTKKVDEILDFLDSLPEQPGSDHHEIEVEFRGEKVTISREFYRDGEMNYSTSEQDDNAIWSALRAWCEKKGITAFELYPQQPEQPMEGLEEKDFVEEVRQYYTNNCTWDALKQPMLSIITRCARHFAEWQKAKMLEEALETQILTTSFINLPKEYLHQNGIQAGDKVRVIVIKED